MMYILLAILGGAAGWYLAKFTDIKVNQYVAIGAGALGGLLGTLLGTWFSFAAVILFKILLALIFAYILVKVAQKYFKAE